MGNTRYCEWTKHDDLSYECNRCGIVRGRLSVRVCKPSVSLTDAAECLHQSPKVTRVKLDCQNKNVALAKCDLHKRCYPETKKDFPPKIGFGVRSCVSCPDYKTDSPIDNRPEIAKMFDRVVCINLARRQDRWNSFIENLPDDWPFQQPERVEAIDGKLVKHPGWWKQGGGAWGCFRTHVRLLEDAMQRGENILILEDDAKCCEGFAPKVVEFLSAVPDDWDMIYLGGQHLRAKRHQPKRVNRHVYTPYNINRTHAYAVSQKMLRPLYEHLTSIGDWRRGHHIDHRYGLLHQRQTDAIYCPAEWLIAQSADRSNINGREFKKDRFWANAGVLSDETPQLPFIAIAGLHGSGSSAVAGVLWHLGVHMGNELHGKWTAHGFEDRQLASIMEQVIPFPAIAPQLKPGQRWRALKLWIAKKKQEAEKLGTIAGGKYPMLCQAAGPLVTSTGELLTVVACDRPIEESIASITRRCPKRDSDRLRRHQEWLAEGKRVLCRKAAKVVRVDYNTLLNDTEAEVVRLAGELPIEASEEQIAAAVASVDKSKRHIEVMA